MSMQDIVCGKVATFRLASITTSNSQAYSSYAVLLCPLLDWFFFKFRQNQRGITMKVCNSYNVELVKKMFVFGGKDK
jgi:hypothetical protein